VVRRTWFVAACCVDVNVLCLKPDHRGAAPAPVCSCSGEQATQWKYCSRIGGGLFFANKNEGTWTIPKGAAARGEDLLTRAQIEFEEELGIRPCGNWIELVRIKQKGGKIVHVWAFEDNLPESFQVNSNAFEIEWPLARES
jgi:8-oxo-dGTP pyrophosphatase MutT (NUDIX family)